MRAKTWKKLCYRDDTFPLMEIEIHPVYCCLQAKHGHKESEGKQRQRLIDRD